MVRAARVLAYWLAGASVVFVLVLARVIDLPTPVTAVDKEHIELYYRVRDDIKEQIASADARATTILTIELALFLALITAAPLLGATLMKAGTRVGLLFSSGWLAVIIGIVVGFLVSIFVLWFVLATLGTFLDAARVLNSDFQHPDLPTRRWALIPFLLHPGRLFRPRKSETDRLRTNLPFSPHAVVAAGNELPEKMRMLSIADKLVEDIEIRAHIARDKRLALNDATRALSIQILATFAIAFLSIGLLAYP